MKANDKSGHTVNRTEDVGFGLGLQCQTFLRYEFHFVENIKSEKYKPADFGPANQ